MPKINFQIEPKAFYTAIAYSYLAGLNPKDFVREGGEIYFDCDRNNTPESQHIEDFLSQDAQRTVSALEVMNSSIFPIYASFVNSLENKLQCEQQVTDLAPLLEEILYSKL